MMTDRQEQIRADAIEWAIRLSDPRFEDWDGFTAWLEADPAHASAYDAVVAAGDLADETLRAAPAAAPTPARRIGLRAPAAGLIAASLVGMASWGVISQRAQPYTIETAPGEHRSVTIGTATIALNGGTVLRLDHHDPHVATLDRGEALFDVRHDPDHPFTLSVGDGIVRDIGTRFDVTRENGGTRVEVAEGSVVYNPALEAVHLGAGETLTTSDRAAELRVAHAPIADIGGWRENRLSYRQAPLSTVAADLSRGIGVPITAAPDVAGQLFTGVIAFGGDHAALAANLGPLLDVTVKQDQQRWTLARKADARL